jgi:hypothetical protein
MDYHYYVSGQENVSYSLSEQLFHSQDTQQWNIKRLPLETPGERIDQEMKVNKRKCTWLAAACLLVVSHDEIQEYLEQRRKTFRSGRINGGKEEI